MATMADISGDSNRILSANAWNIDFMVLYMLTIWDEGDHAHSGNVSDIFRRIHFIEGEILPVNFRWHAFIYREEKNFLVFSDFFEESCLLGISHGRFLYLNSHGNVQHHAFPRVQKVISETWEKASLSRIADALKRDDMLNPPISTTYILRRCKFLTF